MTRSGLRPETRLLALSGVNSLAAGVNIFMVNLWAMKLGMGTIPLGLLRSSGGVAVVAASLPSAYLLRRFGTARVFALGEIVRAAAIASLGLIHAPWGLVLISGLIGATVALTTTSLQSTFLEMLPAMGDACAGWMRGIGFIGMFLCGPILAGLLSQRMGFAHAFPVVGMAMVALALLAHPLVWHSLPISRAHGRRSWARTSPRGWWRSRALALVVATEVLNSACLNVHSLFVALLAQGTFASTVEQSIRLVSVSGLAFVFATLLGGRWLARLTPPTGIVLGQLVAAMGLTVLSLARAPALLASGSAGLGLALGISASCMMRQLSHMPDDRALLSALTSTAAALGRTIGPAFAGLLAALIGLRPVFFLFALLQAGLALVRVIGRVRQRTEAERG